MCQCLSLYAATVVSEAQEADAEANNPRFIRKLADIVDELVNAKEAGELVIVIFSTNIISSNSRIRQILIH